MHEDNVVIGYDDLIGHNDFISYNEGASTTRLVVPSSSRSFPSRMSLFIRVYSVSFHPPFRQPLVSVVRVKDDERRRPTDMRCLMRDRRRLARPLAPQASAQAIHEFACATNQFMTEILELAAASANEFSECRRHHPRTARRRTEKHQSTLPSWGNYRGY